MSESGRFNLAEWLLEHNLAQRADRVCVESEIRSATYGEIAAETARVQSVLEDLGAQVEQRVLLVVPDVVEFVPSWLAAIRGGFVFAMVNPRLSADDYRYYLEYSRAPVAVVHGSAWPAFAEAAADARFLRAVVRIDGSGAGADASARELPSVPIVEYERAVPAATEAAAFDTGPDDLCGWLFTSGTSGKPKAAIHLHSEFRYNIDRYARDVLQLQPDDATMAVSKLFFGYATGTNLMFPFAAGARTTLFSGRSSADAVVEHATRFQPTFLAAVPTTLAGILALDETETKAAFGSLRCVVSAGEALPAELARRFHARFGVDVLDGIGSAELFHIYISNRMGAVRAGSVGQLVPGYEARILDDDGNEVGEGDDGTGEVGTLWVKGGSAAVGYWLDREKSRRTFRGDWVVTGDLFRRDRDGYFFYEGRADDLLKVGGIWVAPRQVEECLAEHEAVHECCVVGEETADGLTLPVAIVVLTSGHEAGDELSAALQQHVKSKLAPYKYPRRVEYRSELPRNDRGKIARAVLKREVGGERGTGAQA